LSYQLFRGDCLEVLPTIADNSIDLIRRALSHDNSHKELSDYYRGYLPDFHNA